MKSKSLSSTSSRELIKRGFILVAPLGFILFSKVLSIFLSISTPITMPDLPIIFAASIE